MNRSALVTALRESPAGATSSVEAGVHDPDVETRGGMRVKISVVVPTLNEGSQIVAFIESLDWVDEIIVVDAGSRDETADLATAAGARVVTLIGETVATARNAGIAIARNPWILVLDADERATSELRADVKAAVEQPRHEAYRARSRSFFLGRELRHGPYGRDWHIRIFSRERRYINTNVHEHLEPIADIGTLQGHVVHRPFRDLPHYIAKVVRYARLGAEDIRARRQRVTFLDLGVRPIWRFVRDYVVMGGCLDGMPGFLVCIFAGVGTLMKYSQALVDQRGERSPK